MSESATLVAHVVLDSPLPQLDHPFDYKIPHHLVGSVKVGQKVIVPLRSGKRMCDAWVIAISETSVFAGNLAEVSSIHGELALLPSELYELARLVADRQAGSAIDVLRLAIPPRYVRAEKSYLANEGTNDQPESVVGPEPVPSTDAESTAHSVILGSGERVAWICGGGVEQLSNGEWVPRWCSVYAKLAAEKIAHGESVIVAVPDFRDIDVAQRALATVLDEKLIVRLDAGLPGAQRYTNYLRTLENQACVVLGNRSSVYAPVHNLGAIAVWDASDESFSEPLAPYAHARDVALIRQSLSKCALLLGAHVLSPEVARLVALDYLLEKVDDVSSATILVTDDLQQTDGVDEPNSRAGSRIPATAVVEARRAIAHGPVLVQVARPGYSGSLRCQSCREKASCQQCSGPLRLESKNATPACRWCARLATGWQCSHCHSSSYFFGSPGTEKTAEDLGRAFPGVPVMIVDASRGVETIPHKPSLVIATPGTEPLAEGGYEAVLILDGESMRSREGIDTDTEALRIWLNAASLARAGAKVFIAGTGVSLGNVLSECAANAYVRGLLAEREVLALPPATRAALVSGSREAVATVESALSSVPRRSVLGPVPGPDGSSRLIVTFDYKDGAEMARALRSLIIKTASTSRRPPSSEGSRDRILRLNVRMDDTALRATN